MSYYVCEYHLGWISISEDEPPFVGFDERCEQCGDSDYIEEFDSLNEALTYVLLEHGKWTIEELGYKVKSIEFEKTEEDELE